ncbi:MAG: hypothetical protein FJ264_17395 [Planctomycetes bacterium]|nr:hypothetical protein [Planctomycetota bacterium]MBM4065772.1 hypothetical protein [Planctomycetota bacterium]
MTPAIQIIGLVIIISLLPITIWCVTKKKPYLRTLIFCVDPIFFIFGVILFKIDLIYEITLPEGTTIKTTLQKATLDAKEISALKERVEAQSATIDLVAKSASEAKNLSTDAKSLYEELSNKNKIADKELKNISNKILPLELKAKSLSTLIRKIRKELLLLQEILKIQQLTTAAKAGSRRDYEELNEISTKDPRIQTYTKAALNDIFFYFDAERNIGGRTLGDLIARKPIECSVDEVIDIYHNADPSLGLRESAINTLAKLKKDTAVQEICDSIYKEQNLRVIARMIRALSILTDEYFETLDINKVKTWWGKNPNKEKYKSCYKEYLEALAYIRKKSSLSDEESKYVISLLEKTIEMDPDALHARCLRAAYLANIGKYDDAEIELKEVEKRNNNYRWLYYFQAELFVWRKNYDKAIESLNQAMSISPSIENNVKNALIFKDLVKDPQIKWPSEKTK